MNQYKFGDYIRYPFRAHKVNLRGEKLKLLQKLWFVQEIRQGRETAAKLTQRFNLDRKYFNTLVSRAQRNKGIYEDPGRPRYLKKECFPDMRRQDKAAAGPKPTPFLQPLSMREIMSILL